MANDVAAGAHSAGLEYVVGCDPERRAPVRNSRRYYAGAAGRARPQLQRTLLPCFCFSGRFWHANTIREVRAFAPVQTFFSCEASVHHDSLDGPGLAGRVVSIDYDGAQT